MCILLHNNRVDISGNIIYFLICTCLSEYRHEIPWTLSFKPRDSPPWVYYTVRALSSYEASNRRHFTLVTTFANNVRYNIFCRKPKWNYKEKTNRWLIFSIFIKGNTFCNVLFVFLYKKICLKWGLTFVSMNDRIENMLEPSKHQDAPTASTVGTCSTLQQMTNQAQRL